MISAAALATAHLKELKIESEQDVMDAVTFLGRAKTAIDQVEAQRIFFTGPLEKHVRDINIMFRGISAPLKEAYAMVKGKTEDWKRAETARILEQQRLAREADDRMRIANSVGIIESGSVDFLMAPEAPIKRVFAPDGNAQFRKVWTHEIVDELAIPRQWLMVDEKKIRAAVDHEGGVRDIPGVRIYQEDRLAVSGHPATPIPAAEGK